MEDSIICTTSKLSSVNASSLNNSTFFLTRKVVNNYSKCVCVCVCVCVCARARAEILYNNHALRARNIIYSG